MKKIKLTLALCLLACTTICLFASNSEIEQKTRSSSSSTCILRNPPDFNLIWNFEGNQVIWVTIKNGNVLGVTVSLKCEIFAKDDTKRLILLPFQETEEMRYDTFGYVPIGWQFKLSTTSVSALIYGYAHWS